MSGVVSRLDKEAQGYCGGCGMGSSIHDIVECYLNGSDSINRPIYPRCNSDDNSYTIRKAESNIFASLLTVRGR